MSKKTNAAKHPPRGVKTKRRRKRANPFKLPKDFKPAEEGLLNFAGLTDFLMDQMMLSVLRSSGITTMVKAAIVKGLVTVDIVDYRAEDPALQSPQNAQHTLTGTQGEEKKTGKSK